MGANIHQDIHVISVQVAKRLPLQLERVAAREGSGLPQGQQVQRWLSWDLGLVFPSPSILCVCLLLAPRAGKWALSLNHHPLV